MKGTAMVINAEFIREIKNMVSIGRRQAIAAVNQTMVNTYWQIGRRIVEEEQNGKQRADYGKQFLKALSAALTEEFGKGFSVQNLYGFRQFYITFPEIFATPWRILTWSHYKRIMQVSSEAARNWYLKEASEQMWSYATLNRNISTQYYERLLLSQDKGPVEKEMKALTCEFDRDKLEFVKELDAASEVCVYAKLPRSFQIPTPVGNYSPDWAIAFNKDSVKHIFFIAETKGSMDSMQLKPIEKAKIECAEKLFNDASTSKVRYHKVDSYETLLNIMKDIE